VRAWQLDLSLLRSSVLDLRAQADSRLHELMHMRQGGGAAGAEGLGGCARSLFLWCARPRVSNTRLVVVGKQDASRTLQQWLNRRPQLTSIQIGSDATLAEVVPAFTRP
jgi:hypothetical protein